MRVILSWGITDMANIKVLDDKTINQIAAGEVVERPVSVVKELVENAIDANATNVSVEIKDGGISLIRVTDNGCGINRDNIRTAFLRHATSKINTIEDLISVKSLGFRGEALSSIAAVSQIELLTKEKTSLFGVRYVLEGGKERSLDEAGIPDGTTIIVRNLFFNTPARRKFLKSPMTEGNYITELMERMVLSHPEIGFKYIINGKEKISTTGNGNILQNIYSVFGRDMANLCVPIEYQCDNLNITGFVGKPECARGNRNYELFFVNNRLVKSQILSRAVEESYKNYLMLHKYPFVALYFDIPSADLDVNVHPAKTEIRFLRENELYNGIVDSVTSALSHKELIPAVKNDIEVTNEKHIAKETGNNSIDLTDNTHECVINNINYNNKDNIGLEKNELPNIELIGCQSFSEKNIEVTPEPFEKEKLEVFKETKAGIIENDIKIANIEQANLFDQKFLSKNSLPEHRIIGQVFDTYWIVELSNNMYIIDQHAAHEKVLYERFSKRIAEDKVYSQALNPPIIVSLTVPEIETLNKYMDNFVRLGFEVSEFGGKEYAISSVPSDLFGLSEKDYFLSVLDDLMENTRFSTPEAVNDRIATMACKAAVKGNMKLNHEEAKALIDELLELDNPYNCPHGRPTIISYSKQELEKLFKRIV